MANNSPFSPNENDPFDRNAPLTPQSLRDYFDSTARLGYRDPYINYDPNHLPEPARFSFTAGTHPASQGLAEPVQPSEPRPVGITLRSAAGATPNGAWLAGHEPQGVFRPPILDMNSPQNRQAVAGLMARTDVEQQARARAIRERIARSQVPGGTGLGASSLADLAKPTYSYEDIARKAKNMLRAAGIWGPSDVGGPGPRFKKAAYTLLLNNAVHALRRDARSLQENALSNLTSRLNTQDSVRGNNLRSVLNSAIRAASASQRQPRGPKAPKPPKSGFDATNLKDVNRLYSLATSDNPSERDAARGFLSTVLSGNSNVPMDTLYTTLAPKVAKEMRGWANSASPPILRWFPGTDTQALLDIIRPALNTPNPARALVSTLGLTYNPATDSLKVSPAALVGKGIAPEDVPNLDGNNVDPLVRYMLAVEAMRQQQQRQQQAGLRPVVQY